MADTHTDRDMTINTERKEMGEMDSKYNEYGQTDRDGDLCTGRMCKSMWGWVWGRGAGCNMELPIHHSPFS